MMVHPDSHRISRVLWYSGTGQSLSSFRLQGYHLLCRLFPEPSANHPDPFMTAPQPLGYMYPRFGLLPVRSPLLGESRLISIPPGTEMFHFPGFALCTYVFSTERHGLLHARLPHSDILGSKPARQLPEAFRSLPRPS